jgi:EpsI family protein
VSDIAGQRVNVREAELKSSRGERLVVWYWYWIDGRLTASDALAKGYTALSRLMGRGDDSAVVIVYTRTDQPEKAEATLGSFLRDAGSAIEAMLSATRARR